MSKSKKLRQERLEYEVGSTNVFADLGFENPEEELLKADLTGEIVNIIKKKRLTQAQAAKVMGVDQPRVSSLMTGKFNLFSVEMLMHFLNVLGQDIEIVVKPKPRNRKRAHLSVRTLSSEGNKGIPMAAKSR